MKHKFSHSKNYVAYSKSYNPGDILKTWKNREQKKYDANMTKQNKH